MLLSAKIGAIEFAGDEVRVAVVKTGGRKPALLEVHSRTVHVVDEADRVAAFARALGEAVDALKHPPVVFVLCASGMFSVVRAITIPIRGRKRVLAAAQFELEPHLAFPIEELVLDFNLVAEVDGETEVLAVGVRRNHLEDQMAILDAAGVEVDAVNLDAVAITGLWQAGRRAQKGLQVVLHVRDHCSSLVVLFNGHLAYFRNMASGAEALRERPAAVARDIQNTLRAFLAKWRAGGEIAAVEVTGVELAPAEEEALSESLRLPVTSRVLLAGIAGGPAILADENLAQGPNRWEAVAGAAFAGAGGVRGLDFDRTPRTAATVLRAAAPYLVSSSAMAVAALLLWGLYYYFGTAHYRAQAAQLQEEIDGINTEISQLAEKGFGEDVNVDMFRDPALLEIMADISARMPESKVTITNLQLHPPGALGGWVEIEGETPRAEHVGEVMDELSKSALYRVDQDPAQSAEGNQVNFRVRAFRIEKEDIHGSE